MAVAIPTALVVLTGAEAMRVADRLNARLGFDRAAWTALAEKCLRVRRRSRLRPALTRPRCCAAGRPPSDTQPHLARHHQANHTGRLSTAA